MRRDESDLPDFDWSPVEVARERHRVAKWVVGLSALAVLITLAVSAAFAAAFGVAHNPMALLFGPFVLLGELL